MSERGFDLLWPRRVTGTILLPRILESTQKLRLLTIPCPRVTARNGRGRPTEWCGVIMEWKASRTPRFRPGVSEHIYKCPVCGEEEIVVERRKPPGLRRVREYAPPWEREEPIDYIPRWRRSIMSILEMRRI